MNKLKLIILVIVVSLLGCDDQKKEVNEVSVKAEPSLPFGITWETKIHELSIDENNLELKRYDEESKTSFYSISNAGEFLTGMDSYNLITESDGIISALNTAQFFNKNEQRDLLERYEEIKREISYQYTIYDKKEHLKNKKTIFKCLSNENCGVMYSVYQSDATTILIRAYGLDEQSGMLQVIVFPKEGYYNINI
ncbi:hypothetical protein [Lelliottia nimipressuralis]|uniref:Lipoprotein n=1 Tax=Lelliottia nimipressuralis TaxID=69220 RepID=A0ABY3NY10_9ENTR|nr:hypothetical protein [Lelliottia nimipressuralis]RXJ10767.1 hypothetical protein ETG88_19750 [Lelliottia nimipressuralis]TYT29268.1 hypothetical protein FZO59_21030 [Lelliottia nimipressuralis]